MKINQFIEILKEKKDDPSNDYFIHLAYRNDMVKMEIGNCKLKLYNDGTHKHLDYYLRYESVDYLLQDFFKTKNECLNFLIRKLKKKMD